MIPVVLSSTGLDPLVTLQSSGASRNYEFLCLKEFDACWFADGFLVVFQVYNPKRGYLLAWVRIWVISGTISILVARVTAGVDPGMQKMTLPRIVPAIARESMVDVPISS